MTLTKATPHFESAKMVHEATMYPKSWEDLKLFLGPLLMEAFNSLIDLETD